MVTSLLKWRDSRNAPEIPDTIDWNVVDMARADGPRSLNPDGLLARVTRDVFGLPVAQSLANEKLEALRRFSVRAWYWDLIRVQDMRAFRDAGYSRSHVLEILSHVGMTRGFIPTVQDEAAPRPPRRRTSHCRCG